MRVAIFDFDGTLYANETFQLLMKHLKNHPLYHNRYKKFIRSILPLYIGYKLKIYPESMLKERSMQLYLKVFKNFSTTELDTYFEELAEKMKKDFNPLVLSQLEQHAAEDIHIMLVSGAYTPLLHSVTKGLPFNTIIGTDIPIKGQTIDSHVPILHIQGDRKNKKIFASLEGETIDWDNSFAYGDSYSDLSVLELVGNPVAVNPDAKLKKTAKEREWTII